MSLLTSLEEQTHVGRSGSGFGGLWRRILGCGRDWVCQGEGLNSLYRIIAEKADRVSKLQRTKLKDM